MGLHLDEIRLKILDLAIRGRLVPQDENDVPATELLKMIYKEKECSVTKGKIKKSKPLPPITEDEIPFELPRGWAWTTLSNIGEINPRNQADDSLDASFVSMSMIPTEYGQQALHEKRKWKDIKKGFTHFADNDVALAKMTSCFQNGKAFIAKNLFNGIGAGTTELYIFRGNPKVVLPEYILLFLKSSYFREGALSKSSGTAQQRIPKDYFNFCPFPLPPIAEQIQIIKRATELFRVTDELLSSTTNISTTISGIKNKALQLAIQGKLVKQDPSDEPASVLLEKIKKEKERLIKEKKIKKEKPLPPITEDEVPFELPKGWEWVRLGSICNFINGYAFPSNAFTNNYANKYNDEKIGVIRISNMRGGKVSESEMKYVLKKDYANLDSNFIAKRGDILIVMSGAAGRVGINTNEKGFFLNQRVGKIVPIKVQSLYIYYFLQHYETSNLDKSFGSVIPNLSTQQIKDTIIPLPPLQEQLRIVKKLDQLMAYCDKLEETINQSKAQSEMLMDGVLQEAFN